MRITEQRYHHWRRLLSTPGVVVMMSEPMRAAVDCMMELHARCPEATFQTLLCGVAYANLLGERYYAVSE